MNRLDKTIIRKIFLKDQTNYDLEYWLSKTPEERMEAMEFLRELYLYGNKNDSAPRLQRTIRIIRQKSS
ncbi:MAG: hypothetical protein CO129_06595 [Ignavibacteriales bacterium CG_4_9_14_3_um_filter_34_10]|nr:MAG: hypothetical protein CO129_06595 [Ignavibacteriales bacterium CG_4_9_14_3_um_filter_34_10]